MTVADAGPNVLGEKTTVKVHWLRGPSGEPEQASSVTRKAGEFPHLDGDGAGAAVAAVGERHLDRKRLVHVHDAEASPGWRQGERGRAARTGSAQLNGPRAAPVGLTPPSARMRRARSG